MIVVKIHDNALMLYFMKIGDDSSMQEWFLVEVQENYAGLNVL